VNQLLKLVVSGIKRRMSGPIPKLDADTVNAVLHRAFTGAQPEAFPTVIEVTSGCEGAGALSRWAVAARPRDRAGPALMSLADTAAYALVLPTWATS
jgi:hypothetical protein